MYLIELLKASGISTMTSSSPRTDKHLMLHDNPLTSIEQDTFKRAIFARDITRQLLGFNLPESLVVGIQGPWGSGKSTILNFIEAHISDDSRYAAFAGELQNFDPKVKPLIVRFNPWWFAGQEDLFFRFFNELGSQVGAKSEALEKISQLVKTLAATAKIASKFIPLAGTVEDTANAIQSLIGKNQSLETLRNEVYRLLLDAQHPIWVLIDDIERLQAVEASQMLALIRSVGDLPYLRYVVAFDPNTLERTLQSFQRDTSENYIEKIVQVPFSVPTLSTFDLMLQFQRAVNDVIASFGQESRQLDFNTVVQCFKLLSRFLTSVRQVNRLSNSLRLSWPSVKENVYALDFILLEALKVFKSSVYWRLPYFKDRLVAGAKLEEFRTRFIALNRVSSSAIAELKGHHDETLSLLMGDVKPQDKIQIEDVLKSLFPELGRDDYRTRYTQDEPEIRVSNADAFDDYFTLNPSYGRLDESVKSILTSIALTDANGFGAYLDYLFVQSQFNTLYRTLDAFTLDVDERGSGNKVVLPVALSTIQYGDSWTSLLHDEPISSLITTLLTACLTHEDILRQLEKSPIQFYKALEVSSSTFVCFSVCDQLIEGGLSGLSKLFEIALDNCISSVRLGQYTHSNPLPVHSVTLRLLNTWAKKEQGPLPLLKDRLERNYSSSWLNSFLQFAEANQRGAELMPTIHPNLVEAEAWLKNALHITASKDTSNIRLVENLVKQARSQDS